MIKNISWKKVLPHLIAVVVFLLVAMAYCHQVLSGLALNQGDLTQSKGMAQDALVTQIVYVPNAVAELNSLTGFNPKDTAFVQQNEQAKIGVQPAFDSAATIKLASYDNDAIKYETDAKSPQFAVLSEVYYPAGWNAYIDGKKTDYVQTNYVLRGIGVPAGHHVIDFKFEPKSVSLAQTIVYVANVLFWLFILASLAVLWKKKKTSEMQA